MSSPVYHIIQGATALGALAFAQNIPEVLETDWVSAVERLGLAAALVVFFIITSWLREKRMGKRIDYLEKQTVQLSAKLAGLTEMVTKALDRDNDIIQDALNTLKVRPCLAFDTTEDFRRWQSEQDK